jgi:O-antigen/teichoic acid export membrane protein
VEADVDSGGPEVTRADPDVAPLRRELRRVAFSSGAYVVADGLARGVALGLSLLYTHFIQPNELGALAVTGTVTLLLGSTLGLSISSGVSRLYFECRTEADREQLYASSLGFLLLVGTSMVIVIELVGRTGVLDVFEAAPYAPYLRYAVLTAYCSLFLDLAASIYIVRRRPLMVFVLSAVNAVLLLALSLALVVGVHQRVLGILRASFLTAALVGLVSGILVLRLAGWRISLSRRWLVPALAFSVPLIPHAIAQWILQVSDRPIISHYMPSVELGIYYLGYSIGAIAGLAVHGVSRAMGPVVVRDLKSERHSRVIRVGTYWFAVLVTACLAVALFGRDLLALIVPDSYDGATRIVPVIALAHIGFAAYMIVAQGILFAMRTRWVPLLTFAAGAVNVGLNVLLIPRYGIMAAAYDTAIGFAVLAVLNAAVAHRMYRIDWEYVRWAKVTVAALVAYAFAQIAGVQPSLPRLGLEVAAMLFVLPLALTALFFWSDAELSLLRARLPLLRPNS